MMNHEVAVIEDAVIEAYLRDSNYPTVEAWAEDSDYVRTSNAGWLDEYRLDVDIREQLLIAIEAASG